MRDEREVKGDSVEEEVGVTCFVVDANEAMSALAVALLYLRLKWPHDGVRPDGVRL